MGELNGGIVGLLTLVIVVYLIIHSGRLGLW